jgi:hypothetical protein
MKRKSKATTPAQTTTEPQAPAAGQTGFTKKTSGSSKGGKFGTFDLNGDGSVNIDDVVVGSTSILLWVFSWRGAALIFMALLAVSIRLNLEAWFSVFPNDHSTAAALWCAVQAGELFPVFDEIDPRAILTAMIRKQRKPTEVPLLSENLHSDSASITSKYVRSGSMGFGGILMRFGLYGAELVTLIGKGGLLSADGVLWDGVIKAVAGAVGVEISLRAIAYCKERILTADERAFRAELEEKTSRSTVSLG